MPDASNALLQFEADQVPVSAEELTNQGDNKDFRGTAAIWSNAAGAEPTVMPNGLYDGGVIVPAVSGSNNVIDISQARAYLAGVLTTVSADTDITCARPTVSNYVKYSITITAGGAFSAVKGTEGSSFSTTRGAAGGPPYVAVDAIEIGQVWLDSQSAAAILATEIKQVLGDSLERFDYPQWKVNYANVSNGVLGYAGIQFYSALPTIHTGDAVKDVYASYYTPNFVEVVDAYDWVPPPMTVTINSQAVYGGTKGSSTPSIGGGSFSSFLTDGVSDNILKHQNKVLWFKFFPNRLNSQYQLAQGKMVMQQSFPASGNIGASFTVAAESQAVNIFA